MPQHRSLARKRATRGTIWKAQESRLLQILLERKIWGVMRAEQSKPQTPFAPMFRSTGICLLNIHMLLRAEVACLGKALLRILSQVPNSLFAQFFQSHSTEHLRFHWRQVFSCARAETTGEECGCIKLLFQTLMPTCHPSSSASSEKKCSYTHTRASH